MGLPTFSSCCCLELKWGALIVAIVDLIFCGGAAGHASIIRTGDILNILWFLAVALHIAHIVACILVIVSVFVPKKEFPCIYLITALIRFIFDIILLIFIIIEFGFKGDTLITAIILIIYLVLTVYFWLVIYSWYRKLGGHTPAD
ncbi:uncharacterized protein [Drosophila bipectinata]|uniref:uncharacterized protein n=1 Tax=Drosophila bipectinata TaxID=42026 RepID=UPI0007E5E7DE|nr:uncharacterized protein LOC108122536 [Drosophila bipectinata]KAH8279410.1 hypothetical protein KR026_009105 [Drosophila bipectinata]